MADFRVLIPKEVYSILKFNHENLPGVAVVNSSLKEFTVKEVFPWHLSIKIDIKELIEDQMPSDKEVKILDTYGDLLDKKIKGIDENRPNALFLARVTWNGIRELLWRVHDAEKVNTVLQEIISNNNTLREFGYTIEEDEKWDLTEWYISNC